MDLKLPDVCGGLNPQFNHLECDIDGCLWWIETPVGSFREDPILTDVCGGFNLQ